MFEIPFRRGELNILLMDRIRRINNSEIRGKAYYARLQQTIHGRINKLKV